MPVEEVAIGDQVKLTSGLVGEVFAIPEQKPGLLSVYIENSSGGMQAYEYKPGGMVEVLKSSNGTVDKVKNLKAGDEISWGDKKAEVLEVKPADKDIYRDGELEIILKKSNGKQTNLVQDLEDPIRRI